MEWMLMPLRRFADFAGRSRRREYWLWVLFFVVTLSALTWLDIRLGLGGSATGSSSGGGVSFDVNFGPLGIVFGLATLVPSLAVGVRRLHDLGKSGWWMLLAIIPFIGWLYQLFVFTQPGVPGPNRYGPDPKGGGEAGVFA
ncbi:MAG TPA: DUF805 domain-containing protein [Allosphingosinicella sp.]|nr:DUF805 domain-containing protein [Allosphingosinicella sp.]